MTNFKDATDFDLVIKSKDANLSSLLQILPPKHFEEYGDFSSNGRFNLDAIINGELSATTNPKIEMSVSLEDGSISSDRMDGDLKEVSFEANYSNGGDKNMASSIFNLKNFKGYFSRELMELEIAVRNFENPQVAFEMNGVVPLDKVHGLFSNPLISDGTGDVTFKQLKLNGLYSNMINPSRIGSVDLKGELEFDDAGLTINDEEVQLDRGNMKLENNLLTITNLELEGIGSEIKIEGKFRNLLPVLFADSLNTKQAELEFDAKLEADVIDIARFVKLGEISVEKEEVGAMVYDSMLTAKGIERERLTGFLKGSFEAEIGEFSYNKIEGENFVGRLNFDNNAMQIKGETNAMEGAFILDLSLIHI